MAAAHDASPQTKSVQPEIIAKMTKEIVVKFIEVGKLSPSGFEETFAAVYAAIERTVGK